MINVGCFYTNYTLRGPGQDDVASAMAGRSALISPLQDGCVVVFDEESDQQNEEIIAELASRLSGQLQCPLLAVMNHDDSILCYQLYRSGELVDEYNSAPGYFESEDEEATAEGPEGGNADLLCAVFGSKATKRVRKILRTQSGDGAGYVFAIERHGDLAAALGIPQYGVGAGYELLNAGEFPEELNEADLIKTRFLPVGPPREDIWRRPMPGYYKTSFRALPRLTK